MSRCLRNNPLGAETDLREPVAEGGRGGKEHLEPAVSEGLQVADQLEETQLPLLTGPQRGAQSGTEGIGQDDAGAYPNSGKKAWAGVEAGGDQSERRGRRWRRGRKAYQRE
jgi:hypothetical protein